MRSFHTQPPNLGAIRLIQSWEETMRETHCCRLSFGNYFLGMTSCLLLSPFCIQSNSVLFLIACSLYLACLHSCFLQQATSWIPWNSGVSMQVGFGQDKGKERKFAKHSALMILIWEQLLEKRTVTENCN